MTNNKSMLDKFIRWVFALDLPRQEEIYVPAGIDADIWEKLTTEPIIGHSEGDRLTSYSGPSIKKEEFRPDTFETFIGQKEAKARAETILKKAKAGIRTHVLIDGLKGHGKTTFIQILAKRLNAKLITRIGKQVDETNIIDLLNEINQCQDEQVLVFIDELDTMEWKALKILNPVLESFELNNKRIKPFIFAGATINKYLLLKNNPDTLDRIPTHIKFIRYNVNEICKVLSQYQSHVYPEITIQTDVIRTIAGNCKFNPRTAIALLEDTLVEQDIKKVLYNWNIIADGLTKIDAVILQTLSESKRAIGANALAMKCGLSQNEYLTEFEPYLIEYDYINRVPSRVITEKGKTILNLLKEVSDAKN